jgi:hypothetical protein
MAQHRRALLLVDVVVEKRSGPLDLTSQRVCRPTLCEAIWRSRVVRRLI